MERWRLVLVVLLPFAMGFYLSYLFRTINAVIAENLATELAIDAANLGLLTSVYFLAFAAVQLPLGAWLDRHGPRRVQSILLLIAAGGAALFGAAQSLPELVAARALIGLGVAAAMMAGIKAIILWFPKEHLPLYCGWFVMLGALGGVTATAPAELLLAWTGWRTMFTSLSLLTAACAVLIYWIVPERTVAGPSARNPASLCLTAIYTAARFWRLAPLSASCAGTAWALQGLWAAPWLADVEQLSRSAIVHDLFLIAVAVCVGAVIIGAAADRLQRWGVGPQVLLGLAAVLSVAAQFALILRVPLPSVLPWSLIAVIGSAPVLSYTVLAQHFPKEITGRVNGALNVLHFGAAFLVQFTIGLIVQQWLAQDGRYPPIAYQAAFAVNLGFQIAALAWFAWPACRTARRVLALDPSVDGFDMRSASSSTITCYEKAAQTQYLLAAQVQARRWRFAALGSATLAALLVIAVIKSVASAGASPYGIHVDDSETAGLADASYRTLDAQIEYFLTRFIENVRSVSTDPVVMRANWLSAYDFVTASGARMLNEYAAAEEPFSNVGTITTAVEVTSITRMSPDSFRIDWTEEVRENDTKMRSESFVGNLAIAFKPPMNAESLRKNPLGLYIRTLDWRRTSVAMYSRHTSR